MTDNLPLSAFGGLIAYGVGHIKTSTPNWKWLFLVEAVPGFVVGLFCLYWLPDRPTKNSRFKGAQQEIAVARYYRESFDKDGPIQWKHIRMTITDWRLYMQAAIYLTTAACLASISGFLPTIVQDLGYKSATSANLMTVPPYAVAFVLMFMISYSSDRCRDRGLHITGLMIVAAIAYVLLATLPQSQLHGKYACVVRQPLLLIIQLNTTSSNTPQCIAVACVYATYPPTHAWAANNLGNGTKRAIGLGMYTAIGNCGSVAGTYFYPSTEAPQFRKGHYLCFAMSLSTAVMAFTNHVLLGRINRARDERYGKGREGESVDVSEMADESLGFRFITWIGDLLGEETKFCKECIREQVLKCISSFRKADDDSSRQAVKPSRKVAVWGRHWIFRVEFRHQHGNIRPWHLWFPK